MKDVLPVMKNCILALQLNFTSHQDFEVNDSNFGFERTIIGEAEDVRKYIECGNKTASLIIEKRPIGSLVIDCFDLIPDLSEEITKIATEYISPDMSFKDYLPFYYPTLSKNRKGRDTIQDALIGLYNSKKNNSFIKFYALRTWQEINAIRDSAYDEATRGLFTFLFSTRKINKKAAVSFSENIQQLNFTLKKSIGEYIMDAQKASPSNPLNSLNPVFFRYDRVMIDSRDAEYVIVDNTIIPAIRYYLEKLYSRHRYFQICRICGSTFLAKTANIPTLCSEVCKREQNRLNKQKFDDNKSDFEKAYSNTYMVWYNSLQRIKKHSNNYPERISMFEIAFEEFRNQAKDKKAAVKAGVLSESELIGWLANQNDVVYKLKNEILEGEKKCPKKE